LQLFEDLVPALERHGTVEQHDRELPTFSRKKVQSLLTCTGQNYPISGSFQYCLGDFANNFFVIDHEYDR